MGTSIRPSRALFAAVMIGLGIIGLIYGNSALIWEPIRKTLPGRPVIIYLCAVIEIGTGIGLLLRPSVILACRVLFPFLLLWMALLKLPGLFLAPHVMVSWEAFGEIVVHDRVDSRFQLDVARRFLRRKNADDRAIVALA